MRKYLHIPFALLLIAIGIWGCTLHRSRPLITCFPTDDWTAVSGYQILPGVDSGADLEITPEQLKEAMSDITVRPRSPFMGLTYDTVFMHVFAGTEGFYVEVGKDGNIIIAELGNPNKTKTYWRADDAALYEALLEFCQP